MSRILLADDSPHAQRMGESILSGEGYEVVTVSDGESALIRLEDVDPDLVLVDVLMPRRTGYEVCQYIKLSPRHRHVRVLLAAAAQDSLDEAEVRRARADGFLRKPFEASLLLETVRPLLESAARERDQAPAAARPAGQPTPAGVPVVAVLDPDQVRAAVTVALDASMAALVEEITARVMAALAPKPAARS